MSLRIPPGLFDSVRSTRLTVIPRFVLFAIGALAAVFQLCGWLGLRFNMSPSLPIGIYVVTNAASNLVEFCPPESAATFMIARGYRPEGVCWDGGAPLLKPVVARPGDIVDVSSRGIGVNGNFLPNTSQRSFDTKGRPLTAWPEGRFAVAAGTIWAVSTYNPRSFDSRYFGPIHIASIRAHLRPMVTLW